MNTRGKSLTGVVALVAIALAVLTVPPSTAAAPRQTPGEDYAAMGFGVFMHYGLATFVGQTPWQYDPHDVPATVYDPPDFDADQWMDAVEASGAEYIILTTKHHDGFVLWPSAYTDYGVETSSDPDTDVVGEVAQAARDHGLEVVFYYSWYDKLQPGGDVRPRDPSSDRTTDSPEYMAYAKNQISELLTNYGPVDGIWLDIAPMDDVQLPELADHIHSVSPATAFVPNFPNAIRDGSDAADVATFEGPMEVMPCDYQDKPAEQAFNISAGPGWWQTTDDPPTRPVENMALTRHWINELEATLSLNVSPGPSGLMPPASVEWLEAFGTANGDPGPPSEELPDGRLIYDDGTVPCKDGGLQFFGNWRADSWEAAWDGTRHVSQTADHSAELSFTGSDVAVLAQKRPGHGIAAISVDGGAAEFVDTYSASPQDQVPVWSRSNLGPGQHTVRIEVTGDQNPAASNNWIGLDAVVVTPESP